MELWVGVRLYIEKSEDRFAPISNTMLLLRRVGAGVVTHCHIGSLRIARHRDSFLIPAT